MNEGKIGASRVGKEGRGQVLKRVFISIVEELRMGSYRRVFSRRVARSKDVIHILNSLSLCESGNEEAS